MRRWPKTADSIMSGIPLKKFLLLLRPSKRFQYLLQMTCTRKKHQSYITMTNKLKIHRQFFNSDPRKLTSFVCLVVLLTYIWPRLTITKFFLAINTKNNTSKVLKATKSVPDYLPSSPANTKWHKVTPNVHFIIQQQLNQNLDLRVLTRHFYYLT